MKFNGGRIRLFAFLVVFFCGKKESFVVGTFIADRTIKPAYIRYLKVPVVVVGGVNYGNRHAILTRPNLKINFSMLRCSSINYDFIRRAKSNNPLPENFIVNVFGRACFTSSSSYSHRP